MYGSGRSNCKITFKDIIFLICFEFRCLDLDGKQRSRKDLRKIFCLSMVP